ncbi:MAG: tetratricopeptide repeat protein [Anaerolineae bacterium]
METTTELVQQGLAAARVGDVADARRLLEAATQQNPESIEAWLALAGVVEPLTAKSDCFQRVLALNPENPEAKAGLALLQQKLANQSALGPAAQPVTEAGVSYCYRHPQTETSLRCNRCNRPICPKCARRTPVGFRCPECLREHEDKFYTGTNTDYLLAVLIALPLSVIAGGLFTFILGRLPFFILISLFVAPAVAGLIAETVRWAVKKRRSRYLGHIVTACLVLGIAPFALFMLLAGQWFALISPGIYIAVGVATIMARLR